MLVAIDSNLLRDTILPNEEVRIYLHPGTFQRFRQLKNKIIVISSNTPENWGFLHA